ncbi:hypothetical protein D3C86_1723240 [compost metagenome]
MNRAIFREIEKALPQDFSVEALRQLAIDLRENGVSKAEILENFREFDLALKNNERNEASDYVEEVMDMMAGYYVGRKS